MFRPEVGDYLEMIAMPSFNVFNRPFYAQVIETGGNLKLRVLCGEYAVDAAKPTKYRGETFYMPTEPIAYSPSLQYRYFREADAPDEMWAAIAAAALTDERNG